MKLDLEQAERLIGELFQRVMALEKNLVATQRKAVAYGDQVSIGYNSEQGVSLVVQGWIDRKPDRLHIEARVGK